MQDERGNFYDDLVSRREERTLLGLDRRFDVDHIRTKKSIEKYFYAIIRRHVQKTDKVLDFGCGPGMFLPFLSEISQEVTGIDSSAEFARIAEALVAREECGNVRVLHKDICESGISPEQYDVVIVLDVIHHLSEPYATLREVTKSLKQEGTLIVYEPNKLNPLLFLLHLWDPNERGLLSFGTRGAYRKLIADHYEIEVCEYNGLTLGPTSKSFDVIADILNWPLVKVFLGWLNPKILVVARKRRPTSK